MPDEPETPSEGTSPEAGLDVGLGVAAVARRLGMAGATLRTWDRRYGIGPTDHTPGRHRRYRPDDIARLELMRHALLHGATPAAAAAYALTTPLPDVAETARPAGEGEPDLPPPAAERLVRALNRAATALDAAAIRELLNESITAFGAQITWDFVVRPVLRAAAQRWVDTGTGIEVEHLLSDCVTGVFSALAASTPTPSATRQVAARPVLLAGMAGDQHRLPIVVLAATLTQRGVPCRSLGTDLPAHALVAAIRRTAPAAVLLWSELPQTADPELLKSLPRTRPGYRIFVAGPGWADIELRPRITRLNSLEEATDVISALVLP